MKKLAAIALALLGLGGCSSKCRDGSNWYLGYAGGYQYEECKRGCLEAENPKLCKCTDRCGCWKDHPKGPPGAGEDKP
jgi:hypothetical protein